MAKLTKKQLHKAKKLAEKLKGKKGIDNPHALARWMVQHPKGALRRAIHRRKNMAK